MVPWREEYKTLHFVLHHWLRWIQALPGKRGERALWVPRSPLEYLRRMRGVQRYPIEQIRQPPPVLFWALVSGFTSFLAMAILGMIQKYGKSIQEHQLPFSIAPMAASAVLIYAIPSAPLAQPRNVLVGHMLAAITGTFLFKIFEQAPSSLEWLPGALAVGISISIMGLTNCYHPPAGATAYLAGYYSEDIERVGWWYPLYPVLPASLIMILLGLLLNNICRVYPVYWFTAARSPEEVDELANKEPPPTPTPLDVPKDSEESSIESFPRSSVERETDVDNQISRESDARTAWLIARVHVLEQELQEYRAIYRHSPITKAATTHA